MATAMDAAVIAQKAALPMTGKLPDNRIPKGDARLDGGNGSLGGFGPLAIIVAAE